MIHRDIPTNCELSKRYVKVLIVVFFFLFFCTLVHTKTLNITTMKAKIKQKVAEAGEKIKRFKVKLDYKTFITIKDMGSLDLWKDRYPNAKVVGTIFV